ncbi:biliverdin-producing heme oxygenase [Sedimentitalea todarodis]|uniref:Biliverdin-producing heme oxygenase n=1 Tax=Sedimentitalea todarodis TaxID=1631240 RepID=A0ABU3VLY7_9RHOB|nr:biliverdin-producing heme oxygenase [Sedimentitalea todarodis]MDU9006674.1 biliverdin-producing heme oxygenase [Sedimentitalea todarodis]
MTETIALQDVSLRDVLRNQTSDAHNRLHQHSSFEALFKESLGLEEYRQLIRRFHGFYAPLDLAIDRVMAGRTDDRAGYCYARRSDLLEQDLRDLDFSHRSIRENPHCESVFDLVSPASLGGVLYVIEGATLGGTGIDRAARKLLGSEQPDGRRFWAWCRSENKRRWSMTNRYLEHLHSDRRTMDALASGACDTFRLLADWLAPLDRSFTAKKGERS